MRRFRKCGSGSTMVTATEIACYVYCPEQWRLQYGLGLPPENHAALDSGNRDHWWKAVAERIAGGVIGLGRLLMVVAVLVLLLLWLLWR